VSIGRCQLAPDDSGDDMAKGGARDRDGRRGPGRGQPCSRPRPPCASLQGRPPTGAPCPVAHRRRGCGCAGSMQVAIKSPIPARPARVVGLCPHCHAEASELGEPSRHHSSTGVVTNAESLADSSGSGDDVPGRDHCGGRFAYHDLAGDLGPRDRRCWMAGVLGALVAESAAAKVGPVVPRQSSSSGLRCSITTRTRWSVSSSEREPSVEIHPVRSFEDARMPSPLSRLASEWR